VLTIALMSAIGVAQAIHEYADTSLTSHHTCSLCVTAHTGLSVAPAAPAPELIAAGLDLPASELSGIFRPAATQFIRPPPAA
jgi:hypothetical protein